MKGADVVCSSLPTPDVVRNVYLGPKGVLETARRGTVCFELSTSSVALAKEIAEAAKKKGIAFLDAPVSGSIPHLERKEVSAIVGGDQAALKEHRDVLDAFSKSITYMGKSGNGLIMKLVTNHILNIQHSGMAEGLAFGMKAGLTAPKMMKFLQGSVIPLLIHYKGATMAARDYSDVIANLGHQLQGFGTQHQRGERFGRTCSPGRSRAPAVHLRHGARPRRCGFQRRFRVVPERHGHKAEEKMNVTEA